MIQILKRLAGEKIQRMSGYSADDVSTRGVATEGVSFIQKPFPNNVLYSVVRELLDR